MKHGFTLIELLVVIVILATLVGLGAIGIAKTMRGADNTRGTSFAATVKSAIMAYKSEKGEYPLDSESDAGSSGKVTYGTVNSSTHASDKGNAGLFMKLFGRDSSGKIDNSLRPYISDTSDLYVCKGKRVRKLDEALSSGGVSADDQIGFLIHMGKTTATRNKDLSNARAFAPVIVEFDLELDYYTVTVPKDTSFNQVIKLN